MRQQINLYQDRFREKRVWVSLQQLAAALALVAVVIAAWSFLLHRDLEQARERSVAIKTDRDRMSAELAAANAELAALLEDNQLDREIESTARQKVLKFVADNRFGSGQGFSGYLVALSRLHVDDIWLHGIHLGQNYIRIRGSSLSAERVPHYFTRFREQQIFVGNRFDLFEVSRGKNSDWKVDFEIATRSRVDE